MTTEKMPMPLWLYERLRRDGLIKPPPKEKTVQLQGWWRRKG